MATTSTVFILTKEMYGEGKPEKEGDDPWECRVFIGELVVEIPVKDQLLNKEGKPLNYQLFSGPDIVTLHAEDTEISPLDEDEVPYLLAVQPAGVRLKEYLKEDKKKVHLHEPELHLGNLLKRFKEEQTLIMTNLLLNLQLKNINLNLVIVLYYNLLKKDQLWVLLGGWG